MTGPTVLLGALVCTALAQISYKLFFARGRRPGVFVLSMSLFVLAQIGFFVALTHLEVGVVYMSTGLIHVLVLALARLVLGEKITRHHVAAVALIAGGLLVYAS